MPKPVLSDSLFNADDVATAVLAEANLQVTNNDLGVVDRSSIFQYKTGFGQHFDKVAYSFNGFMFISMGIIHNGSGITDGESPFEITDSDFYPIANHVFPTVSHQGDTANSLQIQSNGQVTIYSPVDSGNAGAWLGIINGFYRFA